MDVINPDPSDSAYWSVAQLTHIMSKELFNNINGYSENVCTDYIPDIAIDDCKQSWRFARALGYPMNMHVQFNLPKSMSPATQREQYRFYLNKFRVHARKHGYLALILMVRSCDLGTNANSKIDFLLYVPEAEQANFRKVVSRWELNPTISTATYDEVEQPDGTIASSFNDLFGAISPAYAARHPEMKCNPSGAILGHRTFYSRHMWLKNRILHRQISILSN